MGPLPEPVKQAQSLPSNADATAVAAGDALFKGNCAQCHAINEVVVGPALAGIRKRRPEAWIQAWVKNSGKLVARGDEYAVKIFNQYQQQQMPTFQLSDQEINQILDYVEASGNQYMAYAPAQP
ncbi:cytochrome c [Hymenobacter perfusus]|uniref:Cytochrome c n=2 Tax=Hymenobacter perfusus TaxID=1236770 RepID=A0A428KBT6_9BACT|nr:cytochrome c [Hymenobacter perfusus]